MSKQAKLPFVAAASASATAAAAADSSRGVKRKTTYTQLNTEQLIRLFTENDATAATAAANSSSPSSAADPAPSAASSSSSSSAPSGTISVDSAFIRSALQKRDGDMQLAIDDLVEATGRHSELHSRYAMQLAADEAAAAAAASSSAAPDSVALKKQRSTRLTFDQVQGDLFSCPAHSALVHCVSVDLAMGKGIAVLFKSKFGGVAELKAQGKQIGDVAVLKREGRFVYYLITKAKYWNKPTLVSLEQSLVAMRTHMLAHGVKLVSMPRIGCGLDGLLWPAVSELIKKVFKEVDVRVVVYTM